jgi:hypothetical protein
MQNSSMLKMWRMAIFIRHICGKRKNSLGQRWFRETAIVVKSHENERKKEFEAILWPGSTNYSPLRESIKKKN